MRQCPDNFDETRFILIRLEVASNTPLHPMNTSMQSGKTNIRVSLMQDSLERLGHHVRMLKKQREDHGRGLEQTKLDLNLSLFHP